MFKARLAQVGVCVGVCGCVEGDRETAAALTRASCAQGALLKKVVDAVKELITDANLDCDANGITMQVRHAMHGQCIACLQQELQ